MKNGLFTILILLIFASCKNTDYKLSEITRINGKLETFEKKMRSLIKKHQMMGVVGDSTIRMLYQDVRKDEDFLGFYMVLNHKVYCTENLLIWQIDAGPEVLQAPSMYKSMYICDLYHCRENSKPNKINEVKTAHANYHIATRDVMCINYGKIPSICEIYLFYKLSKSFPLKHMNGKYATSNREGNEYHLFVLD